MRNKRLLRTLSALCLTLVLASFDPVTEKVVDTQKQKFSVEAGKTIGKRRFEVVYNAAKYISCSNKMCIRDSYYAAVALLIKHEINPGTHAGVKQMIGLHFVATGRMSRYPTLVVLLSQGLLRVFFSSNSLKLSPAQR